MPEVGHAGTLEQLKDYMMTVINGIGGEFTDPDDDWMMVAAMEDRNGQMHLAPLPPQLFGSEATKDLLADLLKQYIGDNQIVNYAILFNVHGVVAANKEEMEKSLAQQRRGIRLQYQPGAVELLLLVVGNALQETSYQAEILRDGEHPPTLGEWKEASETQGRFSQFREAIKPIEI